MDFGKHTERFTFLIRDHGPQFTAGFHAAFRAELLDQTLGWNLAHLRRVLNAYETFYNEHRPHRALSQAAPQRPLPDNVIDLDHLRVTRGGRISGILHEYHIAA